MITSTEELLYLAVKERVIAYRFPQGRRISLRTIAEGYGVDSWSVRNVFDRLVVEGLVAKVEKRSFIAPALCADTVVGACHIARHVLSVGLENLRADPRFRFPRRQPIEQILALVRRCPADDRELLADYLGSLFATIAGLTRTAAIIATIARSNNRLYYVRALDCQGMNNVKDELERLCVLLLEQDWDRLIVAVDEYYRRRARVVSDLIQPVSR